MSASTSQRVRVGLVLVLLALPGLSLAYVNPYTGWQHQSWAEAGMFTALSQMQQDNAFYLRSIDVLGGQPARERERRGRREAAAPEPGPAASARSAKAEAAKPDIAATDFQPSGPRRVPEQFAELLGDRGDAELMRTLHGAIDGMDGFRRHNLAYAMAFALYASIQAAEQRLLDEAQQYALIDLVNEFLVEGGAFASMSDSARTDAYDFFVVTGALITALDHEGRKQRDRGMRDGAKLLANATLEAFGWPR